MSTSNTYLAVFLGSKTSPRRAAWDALPQADRRAKEQEGMQAWKAWAEKHPHFTIFPGEAVEIMPVLPIPGA
jgi:hypothetical protein